MRIFERSYGAAKVVTGSAHLIVTPKSKVLIDFGMFQGEDEELNYQKLDFNPKEIDALILTHGHLDHVGRIPLLYKHGFRGKVFATEATFDILKVVLKDSAKLQMEDYKTREKKAKRLNQNAKPPLYTKKDVKEALKLMKKVITHYNKPIHITKDIIAVFKNAGHIIGSSFIEIFYQKKHIVFSGDLGNKSTPLLPSPQKPGVADSLFIESTYGDRNHKSFKESKKELINAITNTIKKGNVIIPTFAIERAQLLLCILKEMSQKGLLKNAKVYLDSPMAKKVTNVYKKHSYLLSKECQKYKKHPFEFKELKLIKSVNESKKINNIKKGAIIIAGSGMLSGGRILHHLKHNIWNEFSSLIFVGYQAKGTLGRKIIDGAKFIEIYNEKVAVNAKIYTINGFSAHADQSELIEWMKEFDRLEKIYLIHGEEEKQKIFQETIQKTLKKPSHIVEMKETIYL